MSDIDGTSVDAVDTSAMTDSALDVSSVTDLKIDSAQLLARDFGLKLQSAQTILKFSQSKQLNRDLRNAGLKPKELLPLTKFEMPSSETVSKVAAILGENPRRIEAVFSSMIADLKPAR